MNNLKRNKMNKNYERALYFFAGIGAWNLIMYILNL